MDDSDPAWIDRLHGVVDDLTAPLVRAHGDALRCRATCHGCCVDGLTVFAIEAERIARAHAELLAQGAPHPEGACAFLDADGRCRIYAVRPYVCRTQGLPLRWLERDEDGEAYEARDVCELNLVGVALEELPADRLWTLGPIEERLAARQGDGRRVALRSLFAAEKHHLPVID